MVPPPGRRALGYVAHRRGERNHYTRCAEICKCKWCEWFHSPVGGIPAEGACFQPRKQPQGCIQSPAAQGTARPSAALLERRAVVAVLLRFKLRRRADLHRAPVHRAAANATLKPGTATPSALSFPALNGGACRASGQRRAHCDLPPPRGRSRRDRLCLSPWCRKLSRISPRSMRGQHEQVIFTIG